jgi:hypothetical protein
MYFRYTTLQIASALNIKIEPPITLLCSKHQRIRDAAVILVPSKGTSLKAMCSILCQRAHGSVVFKTVSLRVLPDFINRGEILLQDLMQQTSQDKHLVSLAETIGDIVRITKCDPPDVKSSAVSALAASFYNNVKNRDVLYDLVSSSSCLVSTCAAISLVKSRDDMKKSNKRRKTQISRRDRIILSLLRSIRMETRKDLQCLAADTLLCFNSPTIQDTIRVMIAPKLNGISILRDGPWVCLFVSFSLFFSSLSLSLSRSPSLYGNSSYGNSSSQSYKVHGATYFFSKSSSFNNFSKELSNESNLCKLRIAAACKIYDNKEINTLAAKISCDSTQPSRIRDAARHLLRLADRCDEIVHHIEINSNVLLALDVLCDLLRSGSRPTNLKRAVRAVLSRCNDRALNIREAAGSCFARLVDLRLASSNSIQEEEEEEDDDDNIVLPTAATLRSYQLQGIQWLLRSTRRGLHPLLADDMGLGKTLMTLCAIYSTSTTSKISLIVCPSTLTRHWILEIAKFFPSRQDVSVEYVGPRRVLPNVPYANDTIVVTSYVIFFCVCVCMSYTLTYALVQQQHNKFIDTQSFGRM